MSSIKSNIRSSQHSIKYSNVLKRDNVDRFIQEYRRMASLYIDYIWDNGYEWEDKNGKHVFNILNKEYEHPKYIDYKIVPVQHYQLINRANPRFITPWFLGFWFLGMFFSLFTFTFTPSMPIIFFI